MKWLKKTNVINRDLFTSGLIVSTWLKNIFSASSPEWGSKRQMRFHSIFFREIPLVDIHLLTLNDGQLNVLIKW